MGSFEIDGESDFTAESVPDNFEESDNEILNYETMINNLKKKNLLRSVDTTQKISLVRPRVQKICEKFCLKRVSRSKEKDKNRDFSIEKSHNYGKRKELFKMNFKFGSFLHGEKNFN